MRFAWYILSIFLFIGCHRATDKPIIDASVPYATNSIATFREHIVGRGGVTIAQDVVLSGRIVSSDSEENFYGSLVVDDGSGGVEVMIGTSHLEATYPEGLLVSLKVGGCYADYSRGVLQVGHKSPEYEYYGVANLGSIEERDRVVVRSLDVDIVEPEELTISECEVSMCGRLVRVEGLRLVDSSSVDTLLGDELADAVWSGYSLFKDKSGDSIAIYTREYARYAQHRIPMDSVAVVGVLQRDSYRGGDECYFIKMRYESDCTID